MQLLGNCWEECAYGEKEFYSPVVICIKMYARCLVIIYGQCLPLHSLGCHTLTEKYQSYVGKSAPSAISNARFCVSRSYFRVVWNFQHCRACLFWPSIHCSFEQFTYLTECCYSLSTFISLHIASHSYRQQGTNTRRERGLHVCSIEDECKVDVNM